MTFHHIVHTAIDVIEEKSIIMINIDSQPFCIVSSVGTTSAATDFREHYLGPLYPSEQYKMYSILYIVITLLTLDMDTLPIQELSLLLSLKIQLVNQKILKLIL